jgi:hypothetical protein
VPDTGPERYEQRIAARLAAAGCRLRHDKVALRLVEGVKAGLPQEACNARIIVFTVTAPIKHPAKTIATLVHLLTDVPAKGLRTIVHGNLVHARRLAGVSSGTAGVFGFVHNPDYEGGFLLDLAEPVFIHE